MFGEGAVIMECGRAGSVGRPIDLYFPGLEAFSGAVSNGMHRQVPNLPEGNFKEAALARS